MLTPYISFSNPLIRFRVILAAFVLLVLFLDWIWGIGFFSAMAIFLAIWINKIVEPRFWRVVEKEEDQ